MNRDSLDKLMLRMDGILDPGGDCVPARALVVHLNTESAETFPIPANWLRSYVSGPALASRLWAAFAGSDSDNPQAYEADNPVVITASSLNDSDIPFSNSCTVAFRSPQTKSLFFNVGSHNFGSKLTMFGYRALILCGRLRRTSTVKIDLEGVSFDVAERLTDMSVSQIGKTAGNGSIITGPAADHRVVYATAFSDGAPLGRGGLGYVLGLKNVKILAFGGPETGNADVKNKENPYLEELRRSGSLMTMKTAASYGWAPVENFRKRTDPRLFHLTADEADRRWGKEPAEKKKHRFMYLRRTAENKSLPDYAANVMLGSNVGCFDPVVVMERYNTALEMGLDCVSLGNILGWASQVQEEGVYPFGSRVNFTDNEDVIPLIEAIGYGARYTVPDSGDVCSYSINGLECGPFDYRGNFPEAVNQALGNWFPVYFALNPKLTARNTAFWVSLNEETVMGLESFGVSPSVLIPLVVSLKGLKLKILSCFKGVAANYFCLPGFEKNHVTELGKRCRRIVREINSFLGNNTPSIPNHFCVDPDSNCSKEAIVPIRSLLDSYFTLFNYVSAVQDSGPDKGK